MSKTKKVSVSELKAHALQIIESVKTQKTEIEVFKRGVLVAKIVPIPAETQKSWLGCGADTLTLPEDADSILEPIDAIWSVDEE
jgi:prevent-host-death family protein